MGSRSLVYVKTKHLNRVEQLPVVPSVSHAPVGRTVNTQTQDDSERRERQKFSFNRNLRPVLMQDTL